MKDIIHADELAITEAMGLTETQVNNLVSEMFGTSYLKHSHAFLKGVTMAIRFDGQKIVYLRDCDNLLRYLFAI